MVRPDAASGSRGPTKKMRRPGDVAAPGVGARWEARPLGDAAGFQSVAEVGDRQLIARAQASRLHPPAGPALWHACAARSVAAPIPSSPHASIHPGTTSIPASSASRTCSPTRAGPRPPASPASIAPPNATDSRANASDVARRRAGAVPRDRRRGRPGPGRRGLHPRHRRPAMVRDRRARPRDARGIAGSSDPLPRRRERLTGRRIQLVPHPLHRAGPGCGGRRRGRHRGLMMLLSLDRQVRVHADPLQARDRSRAIEAMGKIG